jgi:hypothetical protein
VVDAWNSALNAAKLDEAAQDAGWQRISSEPWPAEGGDAPGQSDADYATAARDVAAQRVRQAVASLGGAGLTSDVAKYSSGTATVGFNLNNLAKSRIYPTGWHGNQYVWAGRIASAAERIGKGMAGVWWPSM